MPSVKVWNDNVHPFKQEMKGVVYEIPAGKSIEMEYEEAIDFKGMFSPMPPHDFAGDESLFFKKIRVENPPVNSIYKDEGLTNHLTGERAASEGELAAMLAKVSHLLVKDRDAERAAPNSEIEALKAQVARLETLISSEVMKGSRSKNVAKEA